MPSRFYYVVGCLRQMCTCVRGSFNFHVQDQVLESAERQAAFSEQPEREMRPAYFVYYRLCFVK